MCFFIYAPKSTIELEYVNEHIKILPNGSSQIQAEIFLKNCSNAPINKVMILYPNRFIKKWRQDEFLYSDPSQDRIKDLTPDFKRPNDKCNNHYNKVPNKFINWNSPTVSIKEPDPLKIDEFNPPNLVHEGIVSDDNKIEVFEDDVFDYNETKIIDECRFAHITINCIPPITPSTTYAFKIFFNPMISTIIDYRGYKNLLDRIKVKPLYYRINSPIDVVQSFKTGLSAFSDSIPQRPHFDKKIYEQAIKSIKEKVITNGIEAADTETLITDWRISISFADGVDPVEISESGQIFRLRPFPDLFVSDENKAVKIYQYYTGNYFWGYQKQFKYSVVMSAKPTNFIFQWKI